MLLWPFLKTQLACTEVSILKYSEEIEKVGETIYKQILSNQCNRCFNKDRNIEEWGPRQGSK